jgi:hypothetical protein
MRKYEAFSKPWQHHTGSKASMLVLHENTKDIKPSQHKGYVSAAT